MLDLQQRLALAVLTASFLLYTASRGVHQVREGYVGVYWRAGQLMNSYGEAGINFMIPYIDTMEEVQITLQTDRVSNIPCGTSGGVMIEFASIEVVNRLDKAHAIEIIRNYGIQYDHVWIFDKIHHEINQFCSAHSLQEVYIDLFSTLDESLVTALQADIDKYAKGLNIIAVRVTKPQLPRAILDNYSAMEAEKTKLMVAREQAKVDKQQAETAKMKAEIVAEQSASVSLIDKDRQIKEKQAEQRIRSIEDEIYLSHEKAMTDAEFYRSQQQAKANTLLYTPAFLQYTFAKALTSNTKIYFGDQIPKILLENTPSGISGGGMFGEGWVQSESAPDSGL